MAKARKSKTKALRRRSPLLEIDLSVVAEPTADAQRLAQKLDTLVGTTSVKGKQFKALLKQIMGGTIRDSPGGGFNQLIYLHNNFLTWPDALYVPQDQQSTGIVKVPANRLYSDAWKDAGGASTSDAKTGAIFAFAGARTTEPAGFGEAGLGIRFSPQNTLSNVRFEPEVNCAITYRAFVDFWPTLIAGNVRAQGWLIAAAWERSPVLGGSFELIRHNAFPVFDTGSRDAFNGAISPNITMLQKNFSGASLATTFLVQGGRTYVLGIVAWVKVDHNVTTSNGKTIPHDGSRFKLYSQMVCAVPYMAAYTKVLIP